jgi:mannose/fructose/N-acetylgalactosamine-specific phosphotransferase system component IID
MEKNLEKTPKLKGYDLMKIFFRSFLIQASWNYKGMLNTGFLFTISPGLARLYKNREARLKAAERHLEFFNTHPYFAAYAVGSALAEEEEVLKKGDGDFSEVTRLKSSLCGPLGALGDDLFWSRWRPMCAIIGVLGAYLWGVWGAVVFLVFYNIPHLFVRYWGLKSSYRDRRNFVDELSGPAYRTVPAFSVKMGAFFVGCLVVVFIGYHGPFDLITRLIFLLALLTAYLVLRKYKKVHVPNGS